MTSSSVTDEELRKFVLNIADLEKSIAGRVLMTKHPAIALEVIIEVAKTFKARLE